MTEQWRDVRGQVGLYEVSDAGRVRSLDRRVPHARYGFAVLKGKQVKPYKNQDGYLRARIGDRLRLVHVLVLEAFVGQCPDDMQACHNNGVRDDNRLENLRWDTPKANVGDRKAHGTYQYGERNPTAKLTESLVREILDSAERNRAIASRLGIHETTVCNIRKGRAWKKVKGRWQACEVDIS